MNYGFPDWMFAAVAIAAYELAAWARHRFQNPQVMWVAYAIVVICAVIVIVRYFVRRSRRNDNAAHHDEEDDWRNY